MVSLWPGVHTLEDFGARSAGADWTRNDAVCFPLGPTAMPALGFLAPKSLGVTEALEMVSLENHPLGPLGVPGTGCIEFFGPTLADRRGPQETRS